MKHLFSSVFVLSGAFSLAQMPDTTYDEMGNVYSICKTEPGTIKSHCTFYYATGEVYRVGAFVDTNAIGSWVSYYRTGVSRDSLYYKLAEIDGGVRSVLDSFAFFFFANGAIRERGAYKDDKRDGDWIVYYTDGREKSRVKFVHGLREGEWKVNYRDGKLREKGQYKNDMQVGEWQTFHKSGKLWGNGQYVLNLKHGEWIWRYKDGKTIQAKGTFDRNDKEGQWYFNWKNGNRMSEGPYKDGFEEGGWKHYFESGELEAEGEYKLGNKEGEWKERYASPDSKAGGDSTRWHYGWYKWNQKDSTWFTYFDNGNPKEMWTYIKDAKTGLHKEFYSNGQLKTSHHVVNEQILQVYGCFTPQGEAFKCGTLKMGQGTLVVLDDEGNVIREDFYENGVRKELSEDH